MITRMYESCYNDIILNNVPKALQSFKKAFREYPKHIPFLHGIIICYILLGEIDTLSSFLEKEGSVSPLRAIIESIYTFLIDNKMFQKKPMDIFYNTAVFVREEISAKEAKAYFSIGLIIDPSNQKYLLAMAEYYLREGNYEKGLKLYSQAAALSGSGN